MRRSRLEILKFAKRSPQDKDKTEDIQATVHDSIHATDIRHVHHVIEIYSRTTIDCSFE